MSLKPPPPPPPMQSKTHGTLHFDRRYDDGTLGPGIRLAVGLKHKRGSPYVTNEMILEGLDKFLAWCEANPIVVGNESRPRMPNIQRYCDFMQKSGTWFAKAERDPERAEACNKVRTAIEAFQIEGGAAGIFQPAIAMRAAGLSDRKETTTQNLPPPTPQADPLDVVNIVHPNSPDPLNDPLRFSQRQLDAGIQHPRAMKDITPPEQT